MTILKHEMRQGRNSLIIWTAVIAFMLGVCILIYPEMSKQMDGIGEAFANMGGFSAAFGMDKINFGEFIGFFGVECGNVLGLGGAFFAALTGISALFKEEREHTAEFLLTHPVSRQSVIAQKLFSVIVQIIILNAASVGVTALSAIIIGESPETKPIALMFAAYLIMQIEIAAICFGLSAFIGRGGLLLVTGSEHFRCQGDDFHVLGAQLTCYRAEDTGSAEFAVVLEEHAGVVVEADVAAVGAAHFFLCAHYHCFGDGAFLDVGTGDCVLDRYHDYVAHGSVAATGATEHVDAEHFFGTAVVGNVEAGFCLYHCYLTFSTISTSLQRFVLLRGRVSIRRTVSPTEHSLFSSWAWYFLVLLTNLPYMGCFSLYLTVTVIVLSPLLEDTTPMRSLRRLRFSSILLIAC